MRGQEGLLVFGRLRCSGCAGSLVVGVTEGIVIEVYHAGFVVAIQAVNTSF